MGFTNIQRVFLIGIGGIGMSALARYFAHRGLEVCGYDRTPSPLTQELVAEGIGVHYTDSVSLIPHSYTCSPEGVLVVYTPAVPASHSQLGFFSQNGYTVVKRAKALGLLAEGMRTAAVAGTHGKTSTSAMLAHLLCQTPLQCNAFLGGIARNFGSNLVLSPAASNRLVVEADEFDRSFLALYPDLAVITSTDADHLDIYGSHGEVLNAFYAFARQIKPNGTAIIKRGLEHVAEHTSAQVFTYSIDGDADFMATNLRICDGFYHFDIASPKGAFTNLMLGIPGRYNVENALAASAAAILWGATEQELRNGLASFQGVQRRFDVRFRSDRTVFIDDYAHHPQELRAAITSVRELFPLKRITGIFQPHLYSRTRDFAQEFAQSLDLLDELLLLDIYPAREEPIEGISSQSIGRYINRAKLTRCSKEQLLDRLGAMTSIEVLLTMGAGDIDRLVEPITQLLKRRESL